MTFISDDGFALYLWLLRDTSVRALCAVHAYALMTNHLHLLLTPANSDAPALPDACAETLKEPAFAASEVIAGNDARTLANHVLATDDEAFRVAFKKSLMKRAKLAGLQRMRLLY